MSSPIFTRDTIKFLKDLEGNNNRAWFDENKSRFQGSVQEPALAFVREMKPRLAAISKHIAADDRKQGGSLMRIYRDVRFSKDKSPYNTHIALRFLCGGGLGYYLGIEAKELTLGAGVWQPEKEPLAAIRAAISGDCSQWKKLVSVAGWEPGGESLSRPPQGFDKDHPCVEHLKRKDFVLFKKLKPADLSKEDFPEAVAAAYSTTAPLCRFLASALGLKF